MPATIGGASRIASVSPSPWTDSTSKFRETTPSPSATAPATSGIPKPTTRITQATEMSDITDTMRPLFPGICPKKSAVAQPNANDAERLMACPASRRTSGRNGTPDLEARGVPP